MDAIRCLECGDVRWSLLGLRGGPGECQVCGGKMVPERRRPDINAHRLRTERRDVTVPAESPLQATGRSA